MTTPPKDELLRRLARRNWLFLAIMLAASLAWQDARISLGVLSGGLLALLGHYWRQRELNKLLVGISNRFSFQFGSMMRLATLGAAIYLLIAVVRVHPLALVVGLSVVVVSIIWTTLQQAL